MTIRCKIFIQSMKSSFDLRDERGNIKNYRNLAHQRRSSQDCPLSMAGHEILILPMIRKLKAESSYSDSILCSNDGNTLGHLDTMNCFFERLCEIGPSFNHFPKEKKSSNC